MCDPQRPTSPDPFDAAEQVSEGIPLARPVIFAPAASVARPVREMLLLESSRKSAWADLGAAIVIVVAFAIYTELALWLATGIVVLPLYVPEGEVSRIIIVPVLCIRAAGIVGIAVLILRNRRQSAKSVGIVRRGVALDLVLGVGAMAVAYAFIYAWLIVSWVVWPSMTEEMVENAERIMDLVPKLSPAGFVLLALLIGIYEELFFRGFLMTRLRRATGSWTIAVLLSTALFAALHALDQELAALVPITILSIIFSLVTIWRHSILPAIVGHWLFNLSQFLYLYYAAGEAWT